MLCLDYVPSPLIQMVVANRVALLSGGHPGSTRSCTLGRKMVIETPGKQHLGWSYERRYWSRSEEVQGGGGLGDLHVAAVSNPHASEIGL